MVSRVRQRHPQYIIKGLSPRWRRDTKITHSYFTYPAAPLFSTFTGPQRDRLFSLIGDAVTSQSNANVDKSKAKHISAWDKWCNVLWSIGLIRNVFLDGFSCWQRQLVLFDFTQAFRQAGFFQRPKKTLVASTVRDTVEYLPQAFKAYLKYDQIRYPYVSLSLFLEQNFKGYANEDTWVKQQKALPITVFLKVIDLAQT